jgi:phosphatidylinositol 4-kinase A
MFYLQWILTLLNSWFIAEFGPEDGIEFQRARLEFIKSLAAYSLILFILQIKDRHNGNIMFDKDGHMVHIDFGFILSIAPGGGILEGAPFKLTAEMVRVMGKDATSPGYELFSSLCIKAYLACRFVKSAIKVS